MHDTLRCAGLDMLAETADCIGGHSLASVCRLLAEDHSGWSGQHSAFCLPLEKDACIELQDGMSAAGFCMA